MKMAYYLNKMKRTNKTAYESAIHLLNYRPQSEYELRTKLARKGYDPDEIGKVMDKLKHYGYLNDSELADDLFDSFRNRKCYGDTYIHQKLKSRGLHTNSHLSVFSAAVSVLGDTETGGFNNFFSVSRLAFSAPTHRVSLLYDTHITVEHTAQLRKVAVLEPCCSSVNGFRLLLAIVPCGSDK